MRPTELAIGKGRSNLVQGWKHLHKEGHQHAGAAMVSETETNWSQHLSEGISAQRAKLTALSKALELVQQKRATIYTNNLYAYATAHVHWAVYQRSGLLTSGS